jgi:predicted phosphodiesterase
LDKEGIEKVLIISDLHIPYHRSDVLDIVKKHANEISTIILNGDIIDCYSISSFGVLEPQPLVKEMAACHDVLKQIQNLTPGVKRIVVQGNHEKRYERYLQKNTNELNKLHSANILNEVVRGFEDHDRQRGIVTKYEELDYCVLNDWFYQMHDTIFCHPLSFSKVPAKTAYNAVEYFVRSGYSFNTCLVAHTHHYGACINLGKYSVETGSLCKPQEYAKSGKLNFTPQDSGYHLAVYKDGKYDINESRNYLLKEED